MMGVVMGKPFHEAATGSRCTVGHFLEVLGRGIGTPEGDGHDVALGLVVDRFDEPSEAMTDKNLVYFFMLVNHDGVELMAQTKLVLVVPAPGCH